MPQPLSASPSRARVTKSLPVNGSDPGGPAAVEVAEGGWVVGVDCPVTGTVVVGPPGTVVVTGHGVLVGGALGAVVVPGAPVVVVVHPGGVVVEVVCTVTVGAEVLVVGSGPVVEVVGPGGAVVEVVDPAGVLVDVVGPGGALVVVVGPGGVVVGGDVGVVVGGGIRQPLARIASSAGVGLPYGGGMMSLRPSFGGCPEWSFAPWPSTAEASTVICTYGLVAEPVR